MRSLHLKYLPLNSTLPMRLFFGFGSWNWIILTVRDIFTKSLRFTVYLILVTEFVFTVWIIRIFNWCNKGTRIRYTVRQHKFTLAPNTKVYSRWITDLQNVRSFYAHFCVATLLRTLPTRFAVAQHWWLCWFRLTCRFNYICLAGHVFWCGLPWNENVNS